VTDQPDRTEANHVAFHRLPLNPQFQSQSPRRLRQCLCPCGLILGPGGGSHGVTRRYVLKATASPELGTTCTRTLQDPTFIYTCQRRSSAPRSADCGAAASIRQLNPRTSAGSNGRPRVAGARTSTAFCREVRSLSQCLKTNSNKSQTCSSARPAESMSAATRTYQFGRLYQRAA